VKKSSNPGITHLLLSQSCYAVGSCLAIRRMQKIVAMSGTWLQGSHI
jgi:hypothetical protein